MKNEHVESFPLTDRFDYLSRAWSKRQKKNQAYLFVYAVVHVQNL